MTRKYSESKVREALGAMDLELVVYKPQDMPGPTQNRKPADFLVWWYEASGGALIECQTRGAAWVEVKETTAVATFPLADFRPSQLLAMREAARIGLPYLVVIRWTQRPKPGSWAITTGNLVLKRIDAGETKYLWPDFPIQCAPADLGNNLRMALVGEIS